jgi:hypothetical protein
VSRRNRLAAVAVDAVFGAGLEWLDSLFLRRMG